jgi:hypothetical protein
LEKNEKNVKQGKLRIEKEMKITLFSMECSIFLGEDLKSHMHFPIPIYPFQISWVTLINTYHKFLQSFFFVVPYWQALKNA